MFYPEPAQRAEHHDFLKAVFHQPAGGKLRVGIVLDVGQHDGLAVRFRLRGGIKVPHDQIRPHAKDGGIAVARVARHDKIPRLQVGRHLAAYRHSRKQHRAAAHFSHAFRALASSYIVR